MARDRIFPLIDRRTIFDLDSRTKYTKKILKQRYGYRTGGSSLTDLDEMLEKEVTELRNFHIIRDLADVLNIKKLKSGEYIDEKYSDKHIEERVVDPMDIDYLSDIAKKMWGEGKVVWLATKDVVQQQYIGEWGFGKKLNKVGLPPDTKVISELGRDGTLFYIPEVTNI